MKKYQVLNVKCGGCANTLKTKLKPLFGNIEIDLEVEPRVITVTNNHCEDQLRKKLISLGYPMIDEDLGTIEKITTTAKSFVSCAVGKMN